MLELRPIKESEFQEFITFLRSSSICKKCGISYKLPKGTFFFISQPGLCGLCEYEENQTMSFLFQNDDLSD